MTIRFVVDSTFDLPQAALDKHPITVIPAFVNMAGHSYAADGTQFDRQDFYEQLPALDEVPKTSAPPPGMVNEMVQQAFTYADHLIVMSLSAHLSSIHNLMRLAIADLPPERVTLIDTGQISMGAGYQALIGAEVAAQTGDVQAVLDAIRRVQRHQALYAGMESVEFLHKSGRVGWAAGAVGRLLRIRPIVSVKAGEVRAVGRLRTRKAWLARLEDLVRQQAPLKRATLLHTNNLDDLHTLHEQLADVLPGHVETALATPVIGTHTGPHAVGIATVSAAWRG